MRKKVAEDAKELAEVRAAGWAQSRAEAWATTKMEAWKSGERTKLKSEKKGWINNQTEGTGEKYKKLYNDEVSIMNSRGQGQMAEVG